MNKKTRLSDFYWLLVEDDPVVLEIYKEKALQKGIATLQASSGYRAYEIYHTFKPKIAGVLTDLLMLEGDGVWLAKKIREDLGKAPITLITGDSSGLRSDELKLFQKILLKPFKLDLLWI